MPELPVVKPTKVVKVLKCVGFVKIRSKGSHAQYKRGNLLVTVPMHNRDLHKTTLKSILGQEKMTVEEFRELL